MKLATIVTCKGRLAHLAQTAPLALQGSLPLGCGYVLVDWACPEGSGVWLDNYIQSPAVQVVRVPSSAAPGFHKTRAQNLGARCAMGMGASYLLFADADTLLSPRFYQWLVPHLSSDTFIFVAHKKGRENTTGILAVHAAAFTQAEGFDEAFDRYGNEDVDMRLRLWLTGTRFLTVPDELLTYGDIRAIPHDDVLRTRFYPDKNVERSSAETLGLLIEQYRQRTGRDLNVDWNGPAGPTLAFLMGGNE